MANGFWRSLMRGGEPVGARGRSPGKGRLRKLAARCSQDWLPHELRICVDKLNHVPPLRSLMAEDEAAAAGVGATQQHAVRDLNHDRRR